MSHQDDLTHALMYGTGTGFCKRCNNLLPTHDDECPIPRIRPWVLAEMTIEARAEMRKKFITTKQIIVKEEPQKKKKPSKVQVAKPNEKQRFRRRGGTRPKPIKNMEIRWCPECDAERLSRYVGRGEYRCVRCEAT